MQCLLKVNCFAANTISLYNLTATANVIKREEFFGTTKFDMVSQWTVDQKLESYR